MAKEVEPGTAEHILRRGETYTFERQYFATTLIRFNSYPS